jgi:hypothetical protein
VLYIPFSLSTPTCLPQRQYPTSHAFGKLPSTTFAPQLIDVCFQSLNFFLLGGNGLAHASPPRLLCGGYLV